MKKILCLSIIFIIVLIQATLLDSFELFGVKPNLLLIGIVMVSLIFDLKWAFALGIFAGILKDTLGLNMFGIDTLLFPLWIFLVIRLSKKISLDDNLISALLVFVVSVLHNIISRSISFALGNSVAPLVVFLRIAFLESLYTAAIMPLVFKFARPAAYS